MVASCCCFPYGVRGGTFCEKAGISPLNPHTPERSCGSNACPSTLYSLLDATRSALFWHLGHAFHPGGGGTDPVPWLRARGTSQNKTASTVAKTKVPFPICFPLRSKFIRI